MSKHFRPWNIDQTLLLPPNVRDFVPKDHVSRFIVGLVRESLDLKAIMGSYGRALENNPVPNRLIWRRLGGSADGSDPEGRARRSRRAISTQPVTGGLAPRRSFAAYRRRPRLAMSSRQPQLDGRPKNLRCACARS
jgi:hypothetical protein